MYKPCGFGTALEKVKETHNPVQAPRNAKAFRLPSLKFKNEDGAVTKSEAEAKPEPEAKPEAGTVTAAEVVTAAVVETMVETPNAAKAVPKPSRLAQALHKVIEAAAEAAAADAAKDVIDKLRRTRKPNKSENKMLELTKEVESNAEIETTKVETTKVETTVMPRHSVRMTYTVPHVRRVRPPPLTTPKPKSPEVVPVPPPEKKPETEAPRAMTPRMKFMLAMETPAERQASPLRIRELVRHTDDGCVYRVWTRV